MANLELVPLHVCGGMFKNYSYVLYDKSSFDAIVIDPAWELEKYLNVFSTHRLVPKHILLTHTHEDHTNLIGELLSRYKIEVWVSPFERERLAFPSGQIKTFSHRENLFFSSALHCQAYSTPGHSPGSSCFLIDSNLFTGDTLFIEGCGMCSDPEANPEQLYESLLFLKETVDPRWKIYPGHRYSAYPGQTFSYVLHNNLYLHFESKHDFVNYRMRPNQENLFKFL